MDWNSRQRFSLKELLTTPKCRCTLSGVRWTQAELDAYEARRKNRGAGIRADNPKPTQGNTLERVISGEGKGRVAAPKCLIRFTVFSLRPCDWDGYSIKQLQDMLIHAGVLSTDKWDSLEGQVCSEKAHTKAEEKTVIEIYECD